MKKTIKKLTPKILLDLYRFSRRALSNARNRARTTEEVFTEIYSANKWGGSKGEYCSGSGSITNHVVDQYVDTISQLAKTMGFENSRFVDLGCGDFRVGNRLRDISSSYVGADIVKSMIESHCSNFADQKTTFVHLNMIEDDLPEGDVCFLRQVLQHLSNNQILKILQKVKQYRWVFITEHYPQHSSQIVPNLDKVHGADIRLYRGSGVYLNQPPFSLPSELIKEVLSVEDSGKEFDGKGEIKTFLYKPTGN